MTTVSKQVSSPATKIEPMDDQLFQQFFQLDSQGAGAPWLSPDFMMGGNATTSSNTAASVHSTPEIATPQDLFLTSPTAEPACNSFEKHVPGFGDLDVSAILNSTSPLLGFAPTTNVQHQEPSSPSSPTQDQMSATPVMEQLSPQITGLLSELDVTTLAALAAGGQDQAQQQQAPQQKEPSQMIVQPLPTTPSKKRSREEDASTPMDEAAIKRQKNTDAARRSRLRKVLKMESLEKRVAELEKANTTLLLRAAVLESEKSALLTKEASYEQRIKTLESQLAEAHQSLAGIVSRP
ncbi:hypothetical protein K492DRAFT_175203 [Lichtheimia hyalospora FSU 10163]|nr:hypothetical protein K492DRAFT_175203 [Lichtheimia hyalospora FSU 10163]